MAGRFSVETVFKAIDRMTGPIEKMQKRVNTFADRSAKELGKLNKITSGFTSGVHTAGAAVLGFGAAAAVGLAAAAKPGMEFEQQMADLGASFMKTRDEIGPLEKEAMRLGAATKFSATEVAGAMEAMSKAGFTEEQTLKGIAGMTYAAAAAGEGLVETTENVSAVMKGMQIDVSQSAKVADVLALASVKTASSIGSLAESLAKAGPVAKQFNVPLEDTVAMTALLQDAGIDASEAGSAVATMLTKLATPSKGAQAQMKKLGISFTDTAGNMKAPSEILEQFAKASKNSGGNMKQAAFFAEMLGLRGQKAGLLLQEAFKNGKYADLVDELKSAEGTAQKMADLRMNTLTGDIDVFTENVKGLGIELLSMSSGPLRDVVKGMTEWLDKNKTKVIDQIKAGVQWLIDSGPGIALWAKRIGTVVAVFYAFSTAVGIATAAMELLAAVSALNPFVAIGLAIAAVVALVVAFWPEISAFFGKLWDGATAAFGAIVDALSGLLSPIWNFFASYWKAILEFVVGLATIAVGVVVAIFTKVMDFLRPYAQWIYDEVLAPIGEFFSSVFGVVAEVVSAAFGKIADIASVVFDRIKSVWSTIAEFFGGIWDAVAAKFAEVLGPIFDKIAWAIDKVRSIGRETLGTEDSENASSSGPQVVSPSERISESISESTTTNQSELTIRDTTGSAVMTKAPRGPGTTIRLQPSGAF